MFTDVAQVLAGLPLFAPAMALVLIAAAALAGPVARRLRTHRAVALLLLVATGVILAATLTPAATLPYDAPHTCQPVSLPLPDVRRLNEWSLNVLLFVPLGLAGAMVPRWRSVVLCTLGGATLSPAVEVAQCVLARLHRVCSADDVTANLSGLSIGVLAGLLVLRPVLTAAGRRGGRPVVAPVAGTGAHRSSGHRT